MGEDWTVVGLFDWQWLLAAAVLVITPALLTGFLVWFFRVRPAERALEEICNRDTVPVDVPRMPPRTRGASPLC